MFDLSMADVPMLEVLLISDSLQTLFGPLFAFSLNAIFHKILCESVLCFCAHWTTIYKVFLSQLKNQEET